MNKMIVPLFIIMFVIAVDVSSQQPVLKYPEHGSIINTLTPTLQWGGLGPNHSRVLVQVDTSYSFPVYSIVNIELPQGTTSYTVGSGRLQYNKLYVWRVGAYYYPGYYSYSNTFTFTTPLTGINNISSNIPDQFSLSQNYPNPFNPSTKMQFQIPKSGPDIQTFLSVYDILGREVAVLVNEQLKPGTYEVNWDASAFPSGVYFYTISSGSFKETRKMVLLK